MDEPVVRFVDLQAQHRALTSELLAVTGRVIDSGWFVLGTELERFEQQWASVTGADQAVGVGSGFDALVLALEGLGVGAGDEVVVPSNTYIATWLAVSAVGARPVPVEPDPVTHLITPEAAEQRIGAATAAVLAVHLYGRPVDVDGFERLAARRGLALVFDAAQAHGASWGGGPIGARGDATAWSFYPTKNLGALGDGGAVTTSDRSLAESIRVLRNYGSDRKHSFDRQGRNSRLDEIQAGLLGVKLPHLERWVARRRQIAVRYSEALAGTGLVVPDMSAVADSAWHLYVVRTPQRDALQRALGDRGVQTEVHYPIPAHRQNAYSDPSHRFGPLPIAEQLASEVLSLPLRPELTDADVDVVIGAVVDHMG